MLPFRGHKRRTIVFRSSVWITFCSHAPDISSDDDDPPVVVTVAVHPKQSFWLASESYPMHYARSHPKEEGDFLAALAYSAHGKAKRS